MGLWIPTALQFIWYNSAFPSLAPSLKHQCLLQDAHLLLPLAQDHQQTVSQMAKSSLFLLTNTQPPFHSCTHLAAVTNLPPVPTAGFLLGERQAPH